MQATELLREQLKDVHQYVEVIMADVTPDQAHWHPPGTRVASLGGNYAHIIVSEDLVINTLLKGSAALFASTWAGKTGMSTLMNLMRARATKEVKVSPDGFLSSSVVPTSQKL